MIKNKKVNNKDSFYYKDLNKNKKSSNIFFSNLILLLSSITIKIYPQTIKIIPTKSNKREQLVF